MKVRDCGLVEIRCYFPDSMLLPLHKTTVIHFILTLMLNFVVQVSVEGHKVHSATLLLCLQLETSPV